MPVRDVIEQIVSQLPGYEPRPQQRKMAELVERAIAEKRHALIEAGTGSGKSFGYLIPLLESGQTVVVATGTIALQEQLLNKDLPFLELAYGRPIRTALAKGRGNYVCMRKLDEVAAGLSPADERFPMLQSLAGAARDNTWSGDRAELAFNVDNRFWHDQIASDPFDCLGPKCPNYTFTPHRMARMALETADVIVANHALYFADLAQGGGLLPQHEVVVFDEAHHLDRAAVSALTTDVNRWEAQRLLQRVQRRFPGLPPRIIQGLNDAEGELMEFLFRRGRGQFKLERDPEFESHAAMMAKAVARLAMWLQSADASQMALLDVDPEQAQLRAQTQRDQMRSVAEDLGRRWDHFAELRLGDLRANWIFTDPVRDYYDINSAPLEVGPLLGEILWGKKTCILTSATLAVDGKFDFLKHELGLTGRTLEGVLGSPFDFANQALFYVPRSLPAPNDAAFLDAACAEIERLLSMTRGRAFVLCTSHRAMREIGIRLAGKIPFPSRTQEDLPRARLIEWFKTTPNAVLFATATFWEGVDVPGDSLSCVIIDKLPFANPEDPVVQARTDRMKAQDEDWFGGFVLPRAILALKQGFGRLIRTRTDTGIVALLDRRVLTMRYGETVLRSLPPARRISSLAETLAEALAAPPEVPGTPSGAAGPVQPPARRAAPPDDLNAALALFDAERERP